MICPHCTVFFHAEWTQTTLDTPRPTSAQWVCRVAVCPSCMEPVIEISKLRPVEHGYTRRENRRIVHPRSPTRSHIDAAVPESFRADYTEACQVLEASAKASAALSRRVLQGVLTDQGYNCSNLAEQIDSVLAESDPKKRLPGHFQDTIDAVRHFGNFAAHPITELTSLQIIDVEPEEAEWCLEIIEALFDHYYVTPARAQDRLEQLNQKLAQAGRPKAKS